MSEIVWRTRSTLLPEKHAAAIKELWLADGWELVCYEPSTTVPGAVWMEAKKRELQPKTF